MYIVSVRQYHLVSIVFSQSSSAPTVFLGCCILELHSRHAALGLAWFVTSLPVANQLKSNKTPSSKAATLLTSATAFERTTAARAALLACDALVLWVSASILRASPRRASPCVYWNANRDDVDARTRLASRLFSNAKAPAGNDAWKIWFSTFFSNMPLLWIYHSLHLLLLCFIHQLICSWLVRNLFQHHRGVGTVFLVWQ